ncbi:hypothetical protein PR001_g8270 [Phytophthora rubi]|uniref:DDE-1 domain-containing protein n=1 Tax=Phytophthora rubi TaxID=129364 RepID=A0A6A3N0U7_9STRA|nr:hypothetical protein PR001_g8270 [Phytophthora rubi]
MGPQRSYTIRTKRKAIAKAEVVGERAASKQLEIPRRTLRDWMDAKERIIGFEDAGINEVSEETSALVCQLPTNSTAVCQPLDVGVMSPLKKKITAQWVAETGVDKVVEVECTCAEECVCVEECECTEECMCGDDCLCSDECVCMVECKCLEVCVCEEEQASDTSYEGEDPAAKKKRQLSLAAAKRQATIARTIKEWEEQSSDVIIKSFAKALPKSPVVEV